MPLEREISTGRPQPKDDNRENKFTDNQSGDENEVNQTETGQTALDPEAENLLESFDRAVNGALEYLIQQAEKINEGSQGVIYLFEIKALQELKAVINKYTAIGALDERISEFKLLLAAAEPKVIKMLKVYKRDAAKREFGWQQEAYKLVDKDPNRSELASVPKPLLHREINLGERTLGRI